MPNEENEKATQTQDKKFDDAVDQETLVATAESQEDLFSCGVTGKDGRGHVLD